MAALEYQLDVSQAKAFAAAFLKMPEVAREELVAATQAALALLENLIKDATPVGATGLLRGAWASQLMGAADAGEVLGRVFNPLGYAAPIEFGTRPHWAPLDPLVDWVHAKLGIADDDEARHVARLIQRKIASKGTPAQEPVQRALDAADQDLRQMYADAAARAFERIGM